MNNLEKNAAKEALTMRAVALMRTLEEAENDD